MSNDLISRLRAKAAKGGIIPIGDMTIREAADELARMGDSNRIEIERLNAQVLILERVRVLTAMISDPRQWVQNEWTQRIAAELQCILEDAP